ncbi:myosin-G heavy chain-like [Metopolophium dirhodum]|uniref:myosin-G heavy chain-like n=1 Tax=Metopolophium dirhodum TaxID=44670 RepID=UPI002990758F|nr:myosin-G heavy chain-like [Metopolophium dirhodum]
MSQVANMISKHTAPNSKDGANYKVKSVAGPFEKESQAKKLSKAWSEPDTSDDGSYISPIRSSPKKRKIIPKCNRQLEKEFLEPPKPPTTPISTRSSTHFGSVLSETNDVLQGMNSSSIDEYKENNMNNTTVIGTLVRTLGSSNNATSPKNIENVENKHSSIDDINVSPLLQVSNTITNEFQNLSSSFRSTPKEYIESFTTRFTSPACSSYEQNKSDSKSYSKETHSTSEPYDDILLTPAEYTSLNNVFQENSVNKEGDINEIAEFICNSGDECNFMIDNNVIKNVENSTSCSLTESVNINDNYCCKNLLAIKSLIEKNEKTTKSMLKQILIQLHMTNTSNTKIVNAIKNLDQKVQIIMKSDSRMKSLALPIPTLPAAFINLLPAKSIEEVDLLESLLSDETDGLKNQEELKTYVYMKVGSINSFSAAIRQAIDTCFIYKILSAFSYKGKTKRGFVNLKLFSIIYEALSGFRTDPQKEITFHNVTDNYIRHSGFLVSKEISSSVL